MSLVASLVAGLGPGEIALILVVLVVFVGVPVIVLLLVTGLIRRNRAKTPVDGVPEDVLGLRQEVAALRAEVRSALRHLAVVRYDAFDDVGGQLSWSVALLDDGGDGVVLTSIHGRSDARTYAKGVAGWRSEQQLSPEEQAAIADARP
jgi:hypothetical protein